MKIVPQSLLLNPFSLLGLVLGLGCVAGPILVCLPNQPADSTAKISSRPTSQHFQPLTREAGGADEYFGESVAVHDSIALVGCPQKRIGGAIVGCAQLFHQDLLGHWRPAFTIEEPNVGVGALFGSSVAAGAHRVLVATCPGDAVQPNAPAAYVYEEGDYNHWRRTAKLSMGHRRPTVLLSASVALDRDTAIIGHVCHDVDTEQPHGLARLYRADAKGHWRQLASLTLPDETDAGFSNFGRAVALDGPRALVSAPMHDSRAGSCGAAYVYQEDEQGFWRQTSQLLAKDPHNCDLFGISVAICDRTALVGAIGVDENAHNSGAVYVFREMDSGRWTQVARFTPSDAANSDYFGRSVSLFGDLAVIGAPGYNDGAGAVYIFRLSESGAEQIAKLAPQGTQPRSGFGRAVAVHGDKILAGAPGEDLADKDNSGAAYAVELSQPPTPSSIARWLAAGNQSFR